MFYRILLYKMFARFNFYLYYKNPMYPYTSVQIAIQEKSHSRAAH